MASGFLLGLKRPLEIQRVINRDGDLSGDLSEQFLLIFRECVFAETPHAQHAELAAMHYERDTSARSDADARKLFFEIGVDFFRAGTIDENRLARGERHSSKAAFNWKRRPLRDGKLLVGEIVRVGSQLIGVGVIKR